MVSTGRVQESRCGVTYVCRPSDPDAYRAAGPGSVYVEFRLGPEHLVRTGDRWARVIGPRSSEARLKGRGPVTGMPPAFDIVVRAQK